MSKIILPIQAEAFRIFYDWGVKWAVLLQEKDGTAARELITNATSPTYHNVTLNSSRTPDGNSAPDFDGTTGYIDTITTTLNTVFNGDLHTFGAIVLVGAAGDWTDGQNRFILNIRADANNRTSIFKSSNGGQISTQRTASGSTDTLAYTTASPTGWFYMAAEWNKAGNTSELFYNGASVDTDVCTGAWSGTPVDTDTIVGARNQTPNGPWSGDIAMVYFTNSLLGATKHLRFAKALGLA